MNFNIKKEQEERSLPLRLFFLSLSLSLSLSCILFCHFIAMWCWRGCYWVLRLHVPFLLYRTRSYGKTHLYVRERESIFLEYPINFQFSMLKVSNW